MHDIVYCCSLMIVDWRKAEMKQYLKTGSSYQVLDKKPQPSLDFYFRLAHWWNPLENLKLMYTQGTSINILSASELLHALYNGVTGRTIDNCL